MAIENPLDSDNIVGKNKKKNKKKKRGTRGLARADPSTVTLS
jgi:hypothetical protein